MARPVERYVRAMDDFAMLNFTWAHLGVIGLAADIAGAIVLGLSFSAKKPEAIRAEVPTGISTLPTTKVSRACRFPRSSPRA